MPRVDGGKGVWGSHQPQIDWYAALYTATTMLLSNCTPTAGVAQSLTGGRVTRGAGVSVCLYNHHVALHVWEGGKQCLGVPND